MKKKCSAFQGAIVKLTLQVFSDSNKSVAVAKFTISLVSHPFVFAKIRSSANQPFVMSLRALKFDTPRYFSSTFRLMASPPMGCWPCPLRLPWFLSPLKICGMSNKASVLSSRELYVCVDTLNKIHIYIYIKTWILVRYI